MVRNKNQQSQKGFSLFELIIYIAITGVAGGLMVGILTNILKVQVKESASVEVMGQLNFVNQTIQRLVRESSLIETVTPSTLKLRMADPAKDPTCISLSSGVVKLAEGPNVPWDLQNCTTVTSDLTSDKVIVDSLDFTKFSQYPGHDAIQINIAMTSKENSQVSQELRSGVARVSAATFDDGLYPGATNTWDIGLPGTSWKNLYLSGAIQAGGDICTTVTGSSKCLSSGGGGGGGTLTGSGIADSIAKWTGPTSLGDSAIYQSGGSIGIGTTNPTVQFERSCPSGFTDVKSGDNQLGCIQTSNAGSMTWPNASKYCFETYGGRLPTRAEWFIAFSYYSFTTYNAWDWNNDIMSDSPVRYTLSKPDDINAINGGDNSVLEYVRCWIPR